MKLYFPVADLLLSNREALLPLVDGVEYKGTKFELPTDKPGLCHSYINFAHSEAVTTISKHRLIEFMQANNVSGLSFHTGSSTARFDIVYFDIAFFAVNSCEPMAEREFWDNTARSIGFVRERVRLAGAENLDYMPGGAYEYICEPEFISEFVERYDLPFLFDIGHAEVAAAALGYTIRDYVERLPLSRTREVHIHRPYPLEGRLVDLHLVPGEAEFELLDYVLGIAAPEVLTVECYADIETIIELLHKVRSKYCSEG